MQYKCKLRMNLTIAVVSDRMILLAQIQRSGAVKIIPPDLHRSIFISFCSYVFYLSSIGILC